MSFFKTLGKIGATVGGGLGAGALAKGLFKTGKNPADAAMPYLNQLQGLGNETYNPYIQQGQRQDPRLEQEYGRMLQDPTAFINALMSGYQPSEGYRFKSEELGRELGNTAAAGGFRGTGYDQRQQGGFIHGLLSQDMQDYLSNVLGVYGQGLQGAQGLSTRGYEASVGRGDYLGNALGSQAGLAYQGQASKNAARQGRTNALFSFLGQAAGAGAGAFGQGGAFAPGGRWG